MFTPVRTNRTFQEAVQQIADAIRAGDIALGDRLPSERVLAEQMEISRPTVREAIRILADADVIDVRPGRNGGMYVSTDVIPPNLLAERSQLRIGEVAGVLEARRMVEPRVAQLAALRGTDADYDAMRQTIDLQRACGPEEIDRFVQLGTRFHIAMARATRNPTVVSLMQLLIRQLDVIRDMAIKTPEDRMRTVEIHERTLIAILDGEAERIDAVMDDHLSYLERIWERETGRRRLRTIPEFLLPRSQHGAVVSQPADQ